MTVNKLETKDILEMKDLDSLTTTEEVTEAIRNNIGELVGALKLTVTAANSRELKMAIVQMGVKGTEELLKYQRIKIAWVNSTEFGTELQYHAVIHVSTTPTVKPVVEDQTVSRHLRLCIQCGEPRLKKCVCTNQYKCLLCNYKKWYRVG